ncbi:MAG: 50S ribosomal protein L25 [bacterium]
MATFKLSAWVREMTGNQVGALRREGKIPAVVYGHGIESMNLSLDGREFSKFYAEAGDSSLVELSIDGQKPRMVVIRAVQKDPLKCHVTHVDLHEVSMTEKMEIFVEFAFVGEAPAVKVSGGMLVKGMDGVNVRCLPNDLVHGIDVDLGQLKEIGDAIHVRDLVVPSGLEILAEPEDLIAMASAVEEVEEEAAPTAGDVESVQVASKGKEDKKEEPKS